MANVEATRGRVQRMLTDLLGTVEVDSDGDFTFQHESSRVFVRVLPWTEDSTVVHVVAYTNLEVPPSPELFRFIATFDEYAFGHLGASEQEGSVMVTFSETLLGEFLDPEELKTAVLGVALGANEIDDKIVSRFGGRTFH